VRCLQANITYNLLDGPFSLFNNVGIDYFDGSNAVVIFNQVLACGESFLSLFNLMV